MKIYEAMARRYCILRGEDPDAEFDNMPVWKDALKDINAVLLMLDTFGIKDPTGDLFGRAEEDSQLTMDFDEQGKIVKLAF